MRFTDDVGIYPKFPQFQIKFAKSTTSFQNVMNLLMAVNSRKIAGFLRISANELYRARQAW
jgi:hypothetical protein